MTRLLVTGSRVFKNRKQIRAELAKLYIACGHTGGLPLVVVEGGAQGADTIASKWAWEMMQEGYWIESETHFAEWAKHGKAAGPRRNAAMVDLGADLCVAFYAKNAENKGTNDCATRAERAGIPVKKFLEE